VGVAVALAAFADRRPALSGDAGVGDVAALVAGATALIAFPVAYRRSFRDPERRWLAERPLWRRLLGLVALSFAHGAIAFMVTWASFQIFQLAFSGLTLDAFAASLLTATASALAAYSAHQSGSRMNSYALSNLFATFLAAGVLTSMVTTDRGDWWEVNFSVLGAADYGVSLTFNGTLVTAGAVIALLAEYMTRDLRALDLYRRRAGSVERPTRERPLLVCLALIGAFLAGTGLIPVDLFMPLHNGLATSMTAVYTVLVLRAHAWLPGLGRTFYAAGYAMLAAAVLSVLLWYPLAYYNMTAMEFVVAGVILSWVVLFTRNVAAAVDDGRRADAEGQGPRREFPSTGTGTGAGTGT
jgi:branched-subunit amino acid transport protein